MVEQEGTKATAASDFIENERCRLHKQKAEDKTLFVRNILNSVFIILAIIAMVGVLVTKAGSTALHICYGIGITAILVKMAEVMMRMPGMLKKTEYEKRKENN